MEDELCYQGFFLPHQVLSEARRWGQLQEQTEGYIRGYFAGRPSYVRSRVKACYWRLVLSCNLPDRVRHELLKCGLTA